ncbi:MAG TPA: hypothetical protein VKH20_08850 [Solirubrobacterales bacterium]|nr:hypothetical protein [Solirubrobacterales bacterium]
MAQFDIGPGPGKICPAGTQAFVNTRLAGIKTNRLEAPATDAGFLIILY